MTENNTSEAPKKRSKASITSYNYGIGSKPIMSYEATPLPDGSYVIRKPDNSFLNLSIGDTMPSVGKVAVDSNGNLSVGEYTVPVGLGLDSRFTAKPNNKEKTEFSIFDANNKFQTKLKLGDVSKGNLVELDEFGNLKLGDSSIKVLPVMMKINFKVLDRIPEEEAKKVGLKYALRGVFNTFEGKDLSSGTPTFGYFIPAKSGARSARLGEFKEFVNGELVTTAEMYPVNNNANVVTMRVRSPKLAYQAYTLYQESRETKDLLDALNNRSMVDRVQSQSASTLSHGLAGRLQAKLDSIQKSLGEVDNQWSHSEMYSVNDGKTYIQSLGKKREPARERGFDNGR